jgi:Coenzyme PQQ synthesis protein D (PqqD)
VVDARDAMSDIFEPHPDVFARRVGDEVLLVHLGRSEIFSLNSTAGRLWELVAGSGSRAAVVAGLAAEYKVDEAQLQTEVDALLSRLTEEGLLRPRQ